VLATGSHKWLMAPAGVGALYVSPELLERMHLVNIAAISVENFQKFDSTLFEPKNTIQRVEEGSSNMLGLIGLNASMSLIEEIGIDLIEKRILQLASLSISLLEERGYVVSSSHTDGTLSGIVMFNHPIYTIMKFWQP